ncbi:MAG: aminotransferase class III-fold pyridoxal phosphate-dependent enzyme [Planctomycetota bacterium]
MQTALLNALVNDRKQHPERFNATADRVKEVLNIVCPAKAPVICNTWQLEQSDLSARYSRLCSRGASASGGQLHRQPNYNHLKNIPKGKPVPFSGTNRGDNGITILTDAIASRLAKTLAKALSRIELKKFISLIKDSEISTQEAISLHERYKIPVSRLEKDLVFTRARGAWLYDTLGNKYLDMDSNYSATNLGNENKEVALGLFNQAQQLISTKEDRVHIPRARFLQVIHSMFPKELTQFYWQNSGGEAVDKALKIAKAYTKQKGVIALKNGFHGRTHGAAAVTYNLEYRTPFFLDQQDWVYFVEPDDPGAVEALFKSGRAKIIIMEVVQGEEAGIRPLNSGFVRKVRALCDKYNAVMIVDEVQSGFGRCATKPGQWWASQVYGVIPDIMSIGKSFGGGYPVTAVVTTPKISAAMKPGYDGSTFGGNPMAMVAAYIATRQMVQKDITSNVVARSKQFKAGLEKIKKAYPKLIGEIRMLGLMLGFELPSKEAVHKFQEILKEYNIHSSLSTASAVRFLPPLIISAKEVAFTLKGIAQSLKRL